MTTSLEQLQEWMTREMLQAIIAETSPDFSAEVCPKATLADLNPNAIENFRTR